MPVSEETYARVALEDETRWELVCGRLVAKQDTTDKHEHVGRILARRLNAQLPEDAYDVGQESPKLRSPHGNYRIPDVCVVPLPLVQRHMSKRPTRLEVHAQPVPPVVEVSSPSTGDVDRTDKLREYQQRGDLEIRHIAPYRRTRNAWRRQPDGRSTETHYTGGKVEIASLPGVVIDLDTLFD